MSKLAILILAACAAPRDPTTDASSSDAPSQSVDASPVVACTNKQPQPLDATWTVAGRSVRVHVPAAYDPARGTPVVINLHGLDGTGGGQANLSHMEARAEMAGFIAVHPNGTGTPRGWNGGDCCNPAASSNVDDTAFIGQLLDELEARLCVDTDRVHAIGLSNGGFLAHRLGCELSTRIASIGAVAGVVGIDQCNSTRPVPVFHVHGTSDLVIPFNGGGINGSESVATTIARWKQRNGCTASPATVFTNGDATCVVHGGCADGADVELCTIDGGGHQWPGGESIGSLGGKKSDDLDATAAAWTFFASHPRTALQ